MTQHALVVADGSVADPAELDRVWPGWAKGIDLVVAADGGGRHAQRLGRRVDVWVGDGDSIPESALAELEAGGTSIRRYPTDKDETDAELALLAAVEAGAERITVLGALGGARIDHALGNLWLLALPSLGGRDVRLLDATARVRLIGPGSLDLSGRIGDTISLLPFAGDAIGVTTSGLRYPLTDEPLLAGPARGLSNVRVAETASVVLGAGRLLVIETPARL